MRFNPPPTWPPFPPDWSPTAEWTPDPSWPAAPAGWQFWTDDGDHGATPRAKRKIPTYVVAVITAIVVAAAGTGVILAWQVMRGDTVHVALRPATAPLTFALDPDAPVRDFSDLSAWESFGGIASTTSPDGRSRVLDTHDTVDTWPTKWSGVIARGVTTCSVTISGRVRDRSHTTGEPGGYAIGLATVTGPAGSETLTGSAVQSDFGQRGYRVAHYPSDQDSGLFPAELDHEWHTVEVSIDAAGAVVQKVDGLEALRTSVAPVCGSPVIRVWAGSAEFADLRVEADTP